MAIQKALKAKQPFRPPKIGEACGAIIEVLEKLHKRERNIVLKIIQDAYYD